ncbi:hypothetical protein [Cellulomonas alba]|uniref:Uncharacterized protein n=1 Tax=Cellulomonas alba TaxID=3053467 RepID=A0ABT7SI68_9CELL|nr:hypothetical protein [Cellulomonas alba]MDM7855875.1 hypothetical protein [Cellulomonas alba]
MSVVTPTGAASLAAAADELIGPLSDAVRPHPLPWAQVVDPGAPHHPGPPRPEDLVTVPQFDTGGVTRHPVLLLRLLTDLGDDAIEVSATIGGASPVTLTFAPWSEHGSSLLLAVPATDAGGAAASIGGSLTAKRTHPDGTADGLSDGAVVTTFAVDLVQGVLGRLALVLLSEKPRLRREARELRASRVLDHARLGTLDAIGADLGVPRLREEIAWDAATRQVAAQPLAGGEVDLDYRARLRVVRGVRLPSPTWIDATTNGPGGPSDPGRGWLAEVGFTTRLTVDETANPLLVAFRVVDPTRGAGRTELLDAVRRLHLVWPAGAPGDAVHAQRMLTPAAAARATTARAALATLGLPADQPVAPSVANALARLVDLQTQLGVSVFTQALTGQRDDGGSRFELGLGVALTPPTTAAIGSAVTKAQALDPRLGAVGAADDPVASWLLRAAGMRTAHATADGTVYASPVSVGGLVVDVAPGPGGPGPLTFTARIEGPDADHDGPVQAIVDALAADALTALSPTDAAARLAGMKVSSADPSIDAALAALDLPRVTDVADVQQRLARVAVRDYVVVDLGATTGALVGDHQRLDDLVAVAARGGASSALPFVTATGTLAFAFGVVDLPLAGNNLSSRHTVAYRWQVHGLVDRGLRVRPVLGPSTTLASAGEGVSVVACVAYVRTGGNDPYEWRATLPDDALLTLRQYEHLMNVVELATPVGVRADTWEIRRRHVSVDGSTTPTPLSPSAARTYHRYRPLHP